MFIKLSRFNSLRNQMLFGFLLVMLVILFVVGILTFDSVSKLLKNNAEKHIQQTAVQANGRLEAVLNQIDSLTTQVATHPYVQQLLLNQQAGKQATFSERQALITSVKVVQTYANGVNYVDLYNSNNNRLFPLDDRSLESKVSPEWIARALQNKGKLVWVGIDPANPNAVLAIRSISLIDHWFTPGGYLVISLDRKVFKISGSLSEEDGSNETMLVVGRNNTLIAANDARFDARFTPSDIKPLVEAKDPTVTIDDKRYMLVKQTSEVTGWTLLILTPMSAITSGISVLRTAILFSAGIGGGLFFMLSFGLSTIITRPIFRLIKTMRRARLGGLKPITEVTSTIEINELNHSYNQMVEHMNDLIKLVYEKEILQNRTELKALQAQINPHFLFNTLEALYWSLQEKDESELAEFVVVMSDLFRYTITGPNKDEWVTLRDELEHIERYLLIMKVRFGDRISWQIDAPPEYSTIRLPKLLVQPLVENAILHGFEGKIGPGSVAVRVAPSEDHQYLHITVEDDGKGMDEETLQKLMTALKTGGKNPVAKGSGIGIVNVQQRVKLYFGSTEDEDGPGINIHSSEGAGTSIRLTIPMKMGEN
ncbi:sensor histidine kinase [Paenibacillus puldeungensis]|uniref:histidine kinase n=1 Tax=Paenibacillus puldeungensis TaxID=696536 RepID=A0ABW3RZB2_9BACL